MQILQTPDEFLKDFVSEINNAKHSIQIQSMNFEVGRVMSVLTKALLDAAKRGVKIEINFDWVSERYIHDTLPMLPVINFKKRKYNNNLHKQNNELINLLINAGIKMNQTNNPLFSSTLIPFAGRNHIKMYIVDEKIGWIGGLNLFDIAFENIDFMVKISDQKIVSVLIDQFKKINKNKGEIDYSIDLGNDYSITVDVGKKFKSLIYKKALSEIKKSEKSVIFMSQLMPDGKILSALINAAKRGVRVEIITSPKDNKLFTRFPEKLLYINFLRSIKKYANIQLYHLLTTVHVKLILIDDKKALFGSHNFTYLGVILGTEEIMMQTIDPSLITQIKEFIGKNLSTI